MEINKSGEATVKGLLIKGVRQWVKKTYGEPGFQEFVEQFSEKEQAMWLKPTILSITKYPGSMFGNIYDIMDKLWLKKNPNAYMDCSAFVSTYDINNVLKIFLRLGKPSFVATKFPMVWNYYFGTGKITNLDTTPKSHSMIIEGSQSYGRGVCLAVEGWCKKALQESGAKNIIIKHIKCLYKGHEHCQLDFQWE